MKAKVTYLLSLLLALGIFSTSCESQAKREQRVRALYEQGVQLRSQRLSEEATECFLEALSLMDKVETHDRASLQLSANIKDNLGAMYNKHQMFGRRIPLGHQSFHHSKSGTQFSGFNMWKT